MRIVISDGHSEYLRFRLRLSLIVNGLMAISATVSLNYHSSDQEKVGQMAEWQFGDKQTFSKSDEW